MSCAFGKKTIANQTATVDLVRMRCFLMTYVKIAAKIVVTILGVIAAMILSTTAVAYEPS